MDLNDPRFTLATLELSCQDAYRERERAQREEFLEDRHWLLDRAVYTH